MLLGDLVSKTSANALTRCKPSLTDSATMVSHMNAQTCWLLAIAKPFASKVPLTLAQSCSSHLEPNIC